MTQAQRNQLGDKLTTQGVNNTQMHGNVTHEIAVAVICFDTKSQSFLQPNVHKNMRLGLSPVKMNAISGVS